MKQFVTFTVYRCYLSNQSTYSLSAATPSHVKLKSGVKTRACDVLLEEQRARTELTEFQLGKWYRC